MLDNLTDYICQNQADCFALASEKGYGGEILTAFFMNSFTCRKMDGIYDRTQYMGPEWLLEEIEFEAREKGVVLKQGEVIHPDAMHWIGYMYRYWQRAREIPSSIIVQKKDFQSMLGVSWGMHAMSFPEALERLDPAPIASSKQKKPAARLT